MGFDKLISKVSCIILLFAVVLILSGCGKNDKVETKLQTNDDIKTMISSITEKETGKIPDLNTIEVDLDNSVQLKSFIGIDKKDDIEGLIAVEPFISSQPFSLAFARVKDGADINKIKKDIFDNINMRKWLCTEADKLYVMNNGNVIIAFMASNDWVDIIYNDIKDYLDNEIGEVLEKDGTNYEEIQD